jgi:phosphohistidine phosphatase
MAPRKRELLLLRHGIAEERAEGLGDAQRCLTPEGRQRTMAQLQGLVELGLSCDLVLSSPLVRARQTAELAVQAGLAPELELAAALAPLADPLPLLERWLGAVSPRPASPTTAAPVTSLAVPKKASARFAVENDSSTMLKVAFCS